MLPKPTGKRVTELLTKSKAAGTIYANLKSVQNLKKFIFSNIKNKKAALTAQIIFQLDKDIWASRECSNVLEREVL